MDGLKYWTNAFCMPNRVGFHKDGIKPIYSVEVVYSDEYGTHYVSENFERFKDAYRRAHFEVETPRKDGLNVMGVYVVGRVYDCSKVVSEDIMIEWNSSEKTYEDEEYE